MSRFKARLTGAWYQVELSLTDGPPIETMYGTESRIKKITLHYTGTECTAIRFVDELDGESLAPDFDEPDRWPSWLRQMVENHRPRAIRQGGDRS